MLSIGAAYGLVVAVFQGGWARDLVGVGKGGPIEPVVPVLMFGVTKPLGLLLAELPVGASLPGATAGADFRLAYRSNFLLPHRRVAWIRFAERLEEAADFAATIPLPALTRVERALRAALVRLSAHIEAV
jgi:hypothetical protein